MHPPILSTSESHQPPAPKAPEHNRNTVAEFEKRRLTNIGALRVVAVFCIVVGILGGVFLINSWRGSEGLGFAVIFQGIAAGVFLLVVAGMAEDILEIRKKLK